MAFQTCLICSKPSIANHDISTITTVNSRDEYLKANGMLDSRGFVSSKYVPLFLSLFVQFLLGNLSMTINHFFHRPVLKPHVDISSWRPSDIYCLIINEASFLNVRVPKHLKLTCLWIAFSSHFGPKVQRRVFVRYRGILQVGSCFQYDFRALPHPWHV